MNESEPRPQGAHLVGSVPLPTTEAVFRTVGAALGRRLRRIPDGEVGDRAGWLESARRLFAQHPLLQLEPPVMHDYPPLPRARLRPGVTTREVAFGRLGYADVARRSFALFAQLKSEGIIPVHCRFQVSLPTPLALVVAFVARDAQAALEPACQLSIIDELGAIIDAIPGDQLAIQWDLAAEIWLWEGWVPAPFSAPHEGIIERLVRLSQRVPRSVDLGYHLCYGDYQHQHFREPETAASAVAIINRLSAAVERPISWVHLPVPRTRDAPAYVEPLRELRLHPRTDLYLGVLHEEDGAEGAIRRVRAAQQVVRSFGVAAECGLGRCDPALIPDLLRLHAEISDPISPAPDPPRTFVRQ